MSKALGSSKKRSGLYLVTPTGNGRDDVSVIPNREHGTQAYELPPFMSRALIYVVGAMLLVVLLWAALSNIDIAVEGQGQLVPTGKVKLIQPQSGGVIEKLFVQEGQQVAEGDRLVLLDRTQLSAQVNTQSQDLEIAKSELAQFGLAKSAMESIIANPGVPVAKLDIGNTGKLVSDVYSSYVNMREAGIDSSCKGKSQDPDCSDFAALKDKLAQLKSQRAAQERSLVSRQQESEAKKAAKVVELVGKRKLLEAARVELGGTQSILEKTQEQETAFRHVYEQGAVSRVDYLKMAKEVERDRQSVLAQQTKIADLVKQIDLLQVEQRQLTAQTQVDLAGQESEIRRLSADIASTQMQVRDTGRRYNLAEATFDAAMAEAKSALEKVCADISTAEHRVSQAESTLAATKQSFDWAEIKAPIAGLVTGIVVSGKGQVVREGEPLMTVVPAGAALVVEAHVSNKDIGFMEKGQQAKLKMAAFPHEEYGVIHGKVTEIEAQSQEDPKLGSFYKVRIAPERTWITAKGRRIPFMSGMAVTSEIIVRKRSLLDLLLEPVRKLNDASLIQHGGAL